MTGLQMFILGVIGETLTFVAFLFWIAAKYQKGGR